MFLSRFLLGKPLATDEEAGERVGPFVGVAILGLDALASACYGPEALLTVLLPAGPAALRYVPALTLSIVGLLGIVFLSYRQTLAAYPGGGGAYAVAKANLGTKAGLLAAAALALDYLLNAAVAISAGVGALASAFPPLLPHTLPLCLAVLLLLTGVNLRGVRASGWVLIVPAFAFVAGLVLVVVAGAYRLHSGGMLPSSPALPAFSVGAQGVSAWLLLRAFANGCTAMTGVEAVSNGVTSFREPQVPNARRTLGLLVGLLTGLLLGISWLNWASGTLASVPGEPGYESVISRLAAGSVGRGWVYHLIMLSVVGVLALSANTSFAAFPALCRCIAEDRFLPEAFRHRGRRLTFSFGICILAACTAVLLLSFGGITDALIPLFAVGALLAFTLSQAGMVAHQRRREDGKGRASMGLSLLGAAATGATLLVVLASKFRHGAWLALLLVVAMLVLFRQVRRHYDYVATVTRVDGSLELTPPLAPLAVVPLRRWNAVSLKALRFASGFAERVIAVQVRVGDPDEEDVESRWQELVVEPARRWNLPAAELHRLDSPYRQLVEPLVAHVLALAEQNPERQVAVVIPELVEPRWYHHLMHSHTAALLKALLRLRGGPQIVLVSTPWYLEDWLPERQGLIGNFAALRRWRQRRKSARAEGSAQ